MHNVTYVIAHYVLLLGYRPILDAMKSFAVDSDEPEVIDIEASTK